MHTAVGGGSGGGSSNAEGGGASPVRYRSSRAKRKRRGWREDTSEDDDTEGGGAHPAVNNISDDAVTDLAASRGSYAGRLRILAEASLGHGLDPSVSQESEKSEGCMVPALEHQDSGSGGQTETGLNSGPVPWDVSTGGVNGALGSRCSSGGIRWGIGGANGSFERAGLLEGGEGVAQPPPSVLEWNLQVMSSMFGNGGGASSSKSDQMEHSARLMAAAMCLQLPTQPFIPGNLEAVKQLQVHADVKEQWPERQWSESPPKLGGTNSRPHPKVEEKQQKQQQQQQGLPRWEPPMPPTSPQLHQRPFKCDSALLMSPASPQQQALLAAHIGQLLQQLAAGTSTEAPAVPLLSPITSQGVDMPQTALQKLAISLLMPAFAAASAPAKAVVHPFTLGKHTCSCLCPFTAQFMSKMSRATTHL